MSDFDTGESNVNIDEQQERGQRGRGDRDERGRGDRGDRGDRGGREDDQRENTSEKVSRFFGSGRASFNSISNKLLQQFTEVFESTATEYDNPNIDPALERKNFQIHPLDNSASAAIPTLLVCLPIKTAGEDVTIYYSLVLEPSGPQRKKYIRGDRDRDDLQLPIFVEDYMDDRWRDLVVRSVQRSGKGTAVSAGSQTIPNTLVDEKTDIIGRDVIASIFNNAIDAICAQREDILLAQGAKVEVMRLTPEFVDENHRFTVQVDNSRTPRRDTSGNVIRSDIALTVWHEEAPRSRSRDDRYNDHIPTSNEIGTISLALDLEHVGQSVGAFGGYGHHDDEEAFFQPVLNITDIVGAAGTPWALESSLLMIGAAALMSDNYRWVETLRNRNTKYPSLEALDALLLAHPDPDRRDLADGINANTSDQELGEYLNKVVSPELFYGMILNPAGEKAWSLSLFEMIAMADDRDAEEYEAQLYVACDNLTGNEFTHLQKHYDYTGLPPVRSVDSRVFLGDFLDAAGNERDIREWNPSAVLNFKRKHPREAMDYMLDFQDTMLPSSSVDMNVDLATRYGQLEDMMGESAFHVRGTGEVIQLESWFIRTLAEALNKSGMMPHISDSSGLRTRSRRTTGYSGERVRDIGRTGRLRNRDDRDASRRRRR